MTNFLAGYTKRVKVIIDHTKVSSALSNFPATSILAAGNMDWSLCDAAGLSLRATASDGLTLLNFERELHDYVNSKSVIHSRIASVSNLTDTDYYLYYKQETARWEQFLDRVHIDSDSGLAYSVNKPTKTGSPIFGDASWTWDRDIAYPTILTDPSWPAASRYRMWYQGTDTSSKYHACYAYAADGADLSNPASWTRPNLGQVTYGGNTNNNILCISGIDEPNHAVNSVDYYDGLYVLQTSTKNNAGTVATANNIYSSNSPTGPWTLEKELPSWSDSSTHPGHGSGITRRQDGRYVARYQVWNSTGLYRSIGCYVSDTSTLSGDWTDCGVIDPGSSPTVQRHSSSSSLSHGGLIYGLVSDFQEPPTTTLGPVILTTSRNGLDVTTQDTTWIPYGASGAWDDAQCIEGPILKVANEWWVFYIGAPTIASLPFSRYMGLAKIGYGRIGQSARTSAGEGYVISKPITVSAGVALSVNAVASGAGDTIKAELLDASNDSVITGFAKADCTAFTGDSYSSEILWGTSHFGDCPVSRVKIKLYLNKSTSDVKLYGYMVGNEADCLWDCSTANGVWDDDFDAVYHGNDDKLRTSNLTSYARSSRVPWRKLNGLLYLGTKTSAAHPTEIDGQTGKGQSFDGTQDEIDYSTELGPSGAGDFTIEAMAKRLGGTTSFRVQKHSDTAVTGSNDGFYWQLTDAQVSLSTVHANTYKNLVYATTPGTDYHFLGISRASGTGYLRYDGAQVATGDINHDITAATTHHRAGKFPYSGSTYFYNGVLDEYRISIIARSAAWQDATRFGLLNTLAAYQDEAQLSPGAGFFSSD